MIQFQILSGKQAGHRWVARRFPVRIGRDVANDLRLEEAGVWDRHCEVRLDAATGFVLAVQSQAILTLNHEPVQTALLRNGDSLELGSVRLRFWLADPVVRTFRVGEWFVWTLVSAIALGEIALICWLLQ
jgi:pSer/pThr/pTyr-binding forkhead associated (FHA) protein